MEQNGKGNRVLKRVFFWMLAAFAVFGVVCFCLTRHLIGNVYEGRVHIAAAPNGGFLLVADEELTPEVLEEALRTDLDYYSSGEIRQVPIYEQKKIDRYIFSILVVVQNGATASKEHQTDAIFIVSYNQLQQKFTVVAVPSHLLVPVENAGWKRLRTAYAMGGVGMLMNTVNSAFGLDIQDYVYIGTEDLAALADGVNGVPANLTQQEAAYLNRTLGCSLQEGQQQLTGAQAVAYLLCDEPDALGRAERQLALVQTAFFYLQDTFTSEYLYPFMVTVFEGIRTNMEFEMLVDLGHEVAVASELQFCTIRLPYDDAYSEHTFEGGNILLPSFEKNRILLRQDLYGTEH